MCLFLEGGIRNNGQVNSEIRRDFFNRGWAGHQEFWPTCSRFTGFDFIYVRLRLGD